MYKQQVNIYTVQTESTLEFPKAVNFVETVVENMKNTKDKASLKYYHRTILNYLNKIISLKD